MGQCFAPLEGLKDLYIELTQHTQDGMTELGFNLGVLEKYIINLSKYVKRRHEIWYSLNGSCKKFTNRKKIRGQHMRRN